MDKEVKNVLVRVESDDDAFMLGVFLGFNNIASIGTASSSAVGRQKEKIRTLTFQKQRVQFLNTYEYEGNRRNTIIRRLEENNNNFCIARAKRLAQLPELNLYMKFYPIFEEIPFEKNVRYELFKHIGRKPLYHGYNIAIMNPVESLPVSKYYIDEILLFAKNFKCGYKFKYFEETADEDN